MLAIIVVLVILAIDIVFFISSARRVESNFLEATSRDSKKPNSKLGK